MKGSDMKRIILVCLISIASPYAMCATKKTTIKIGTTHRFSNFDPRFATSKINQSISELIHCKLFSYDRDSNLQRQVAKSDPKWRSELSFEIEINPDFKFNNGKKLKASDVAATYNSTISNQIYPKNSELNNIKSVTYKNNIIRFNLHKKDPFILYKMDLGIIPKDNITSEQIKIENTATCGPYYIKQQTLNTLVLEKNHHNNFNNIRNESIVFERQSKDKLVSGLEAGDYQLIIADLSNSDIQYIPQKKPGIKNFSYPSNSTVYLGFNLRNKHLNKKNNRKSISSLINKDEIISLIFDNKASRADQLFIKKSKFYSQPNIVGASNKKEISINKIVLNTNPEKENILIAKAIAKDLKSKDISSSVKPIEWGQFKKDIMKNRIDLWVLSINNIRSPKILYKLYHSSQIPPHGLNRSFYRNRNVDKLLDNLLSEVDLQKQVKIVDQIQNIIAEDQPYFYLVHKYNNHLGSNKLRGFEVQSDNNLRSLKNSYIQ